MKIAPINNDQGEINDKLKNDSIQLNGVVDVKVLNEEFTIEEPVKEEKAIVKDRVEEKLMTQLVQIVIPFFIAGIGMVAAGILFGIVNEWKVFVELKEIIVLVPALLDLKGNLDMSLASRLSTQVNLGEIHNRETILLAVLGNLTLKLLQSIVVGFLASFVACITEYLLHQTFTPDHLLTLIATSVTSAAITSVILGLLVMSVIILSKKVNINPDNVATPLAGSIGDVGTLITLALVGSFFYSNRRLYWIHIVFILFFLLLIPLLVFYSRKNRFVNSTLRHGWAPILLSMLISSISGIVLEVALIDYSGIESYQPVINGVGGNLVSIYSSRLSTEIARDTSTWGKWASWAPKKFITYPFHAFFGKQNPEAKTSRLLMFLVIPGHLIFFIVVYYLSEIHSRPNLSVLIVLFYLLASFIQVTLLFIACYMMVHAVWRIKKNPDDFCISLLTSIGDILGVSLLYLSFHLVYLTGDASVKGNNNAHINHHNRTTTSYMITTM